MNPLASPLRGVEHPLNTAVRALQPRLEMPKPLKGVRVVDHGPHFEILGGKIPRYGVKKSQLDSATRLHLQAMSEPSEALARGGVVEHHADPETPVVGDELAAVEDTPEAQARWEALKADWEASHPDAVGGEAAPEAAAAPQDVPPAAEPSDEAFQHLLRPVGESPDEPSLEEKLNYLTPPERSAAEQAGISDVAAQDRANKIESESRPEPPGVFSVLNPHEQPDATTVVRPNPRYPGYTFAPPASPEETVREPPETLADIDSQSPSAEDNSASGQAAAARQVAGASSGSSARSSMPPGGRISLPGTAAPSAVGSPSNDIAKRYADTQAAYEQQVNTEAKAYTDLAQQKTSAIDAFRTAQLARDAQFQDRLRAWDAQTQKLQDDLNDPKKGINPNRWWESKSAPQKALSAIGLALGTFGSTITHTPNAALSMINNAIDRDIAAQKANRADQWNLLNYYRSKGHDEQQSYLLTSSLMEKDFAHQLDALSASYQNTALGARMKQVALLARNDSDLKAQQAIKAHNDNEWEPRIAAARINAEQANTAHAYAAANLARTQIKAVNDQNANANAAAAQNQRLMTGMLGEMGGKSTPGQYLGMDPRLLDAADDPRLEQVNPALAKSLKEKQKRAVKVTDGSYVLAGSPKIADALNDQVETANRLKGLVGEMVDYRQQHGSTVLPSSFWAPTANGGQLVAETKELLPKLEGYKRYTSAEDQHLYENMVANPTKFWTTDEGFADRMAGLSHFVDSAVNASLRQKTHGWKQPLPTTLPAPLTAAQAAEQ